MKYLSYALNQFEEILCSIGLLGATFLMFINVIMRYIFNYGVPWSEDVVRYTILWVTFVGIAICVRKGQHVAIDLFYILLKNKKIKFTLLLTVNIISVIFSGLMTRYGFLLVLSIARYDQMSATLGIPFCFIYLCLPFGFGLTTIRLIEETFKLFKKKTWET